MAGESEPKTRKYNATIQNVVASVDLHASIELLKVSEDLSRYTFISYEPEQFPGAVLKLEKPKVSALLFSSGKMVVTGAKSSQMIHESVQEIIKLLAKANIKITEEPVITVQNIVASGNLERRINLELAALMLETSMYEPEQFPGLIFRMQDPKVVLLLFQSGNLVCTGAKSEEVVHEAIERVESILEEIGAFEQ
ncbi:MAG: TATA-box-binding protein [Asgard group archaeon]